MTVIQSGNYCFACSSSLADAILPRNHKSQRVAAARLAGAFSATSIAVFADYANGGQRIDYESAEMAATPVLGLCNAVLTSTP